MLNQDCAAPAKPEPQHTASPADQSEVEEVSVREEAGAVVIALMPWGISILSHAAVVVLALFVIWAVVAEKQTQDDVIPVVSFADTASNPLMMERVEKDVDNSPPPASLVRSVTPVPKRSIVTPVNLTTDLVGERGSSGGGGLLAPVGGAGSGPTFHDQPVGGATEIVYVIDASGSLLDTFPFVIHELKQSIKGLTKDHKFTVIFFQGDGAVEIAAPHPGLKAATEETKQRVFAWLDPAANNIQPMGGTNPMPGIRKALAYKPQLIFLLSDNITSGGTGATQFEIEQDRLLAEVRRANVGKTRISTIQYLYPDPLASVPGKKATMQQIAADSGGLFRFVSAKDLNLE